MDSLGVQPLANSFKTILLGAAGGDLPSDDQFNRTSFLSHFDGANNGVNNAFDDGSASNHTITANGNATQGSFGPFARPDGEWAVNFDGNDHLVLAASNDFDLSDGDITWEMFVNPSQASTAGGNQLTLFEYFDSGSFYRFIIYVVNGSFNVSIFQRYDGDYPLSANNVAPANTWTHLAVTRDSNNVHKIFANGIQVATSTNSNDPMPTAGLPLNIGLGQLSPGGRYFPGHISNFRLTKGSLVYTSDFTPPSGPLTAITNCKLLTCQSNNFVDNSTSAHTVTPSGNPSVSAFGPFLTDAAYKPAVKGASVHMDGAGDSISAASSADFAFGTGDFTVEFWVYQKEVKNYTIYFDNRTSNNQATLELYQSSNGAFDLYINGTSHAFTPPSVLNRWAHFAISRASGTTKLFVDGVQYLSFSDSTDYVCPNRFYVGRLSISNLYHLNGYMSDFRLVKGTAVYTYAFTPPTAPLTAITNTKLLLNMANGQAIDSAAQNHMTLIGGAKVSSTQSKFGGTSMVFDESGDYVTLPSDSFKILGIGDFTIECFARFATDPNNNGQGLFKLSNGYLNTTTRGPAVYVQGESSGRWAIYSGTTQYLASITPAINTWYHVAYVRSSGVTKLYIDGTERISVSDTTDYTDTYFAIGGYYSVNYLLNGFIDEFRISHMARYTSNFTAPDKPFADKGE